MTKNRFDHSNFSLFKLLMSSSASAFECPVCLEGYNNSTSIPVSFQCGHSCCISHVSILRNCPLCRARIPRATECCPNISLRDGALLYYNLLQEIQSSSLDRTSHSSSHESTTNVNVGTSIQPLDTSHTPTRSSPPNRMTPSPAINRQAQLLSDEAMARQLDVELNQRGVNTRTRSAHMISLSASESSNSDSPTDEFTRRMLLYFSQPTAATNANTTAIVANSSTRSMPLQLHRTPQAAMGTLKTCGHRCTLVIDSCCVCLDQRPVTRNYQMYVDGEGWRNNGKRNDGYCPPCKQR